MTQALCSLLVNGNDQSSEPPEYSLIVGVDRGVALSTGTFESVVFDSRYEVGLTEVEEKRTKIIGGDVATTRRATVRNHGLAVSAGLAF